MDKTQNELSLNADSVKNLNQSIGKTWQSKWTAHRRKKRKQTFANLVVIAQNVQYYKRGKMVP